MKGLLWVVVIAVILIVGYLAYQQGYFSGAETEDANSGVEVNLGASSPAQ